MRRDFLGYAGQGPCGRESKRRLHGQQIWCTMAKTVPARATHVRAPGLSRRAAGLRCSATCCCSALDNRGFQLNRQGKIPFALGSEGHEALQAGAAMAFERGRDILVPYYRDLGLCLGVGITPLRDPALACSPARRTLAADASFPTTTPTKTAGVMSISSIIAAHCRTPSAPRTRSSIAAKRGRAVLCCLRRRRDERRRVARVGQLRRRPQAADRVARAKTTSWAISTPLAQADGASTTSSTTRGGLRNARDDASTASIRSPRYDAVKARDGPRALRRRTDA